MIQEPRLLLTTRNLEMTDSIRFSVEEQLDKLFEHGSKIDRIRVELALEKHSKTHEDEFLAKGQIEIKGNDLRVSCRANDLHAAIGDMGRKLDRMLRKRSAARIKKRNHPHAIDIESQLPKAV